jgi:hypothetical protein
MTDTGETPQAQPHGVPEQALHAHMPQYVLVFRDDRPPKEHAFTAISDAAAVELMLKQYPRFAWGLYHVDDRGQRDRFYRHRVSRPPTGSAGTMA